MEQRAIEVGLVLWLEQPLLRANQSVTQDYNPISCKYEAGITNNITSIGVSMWIMHANVSGNWNNTAITFARSSNNNLSFSKINLKISQSNGYQVLKMMFDNRTLWTQGSDSSGNPMDVAHLPVSAIIISA